jgi:DNA-binding IclR family transcriptional regulator
VIVLPDAHVLVDLDSIDGPRWLTVSELAARCDLHPTVVRSCLQRMRGRGLVEHDGETPRGWARTPAGDAALLRRVPMPDNAPYVNRRAATAAA